MICCVSVFCLVKGLVLWIQLEFGYFVPSVWWCLFWSYPVFRLSLFSTRQFLGKPEMKKTRFCPGKTMRWESSEHRPENKGSLWVSPRECLHGFCCDLTESGLWPLHQWTLCGGSGGDGQQGEFKCFYLSLMYRAGRLFLVCIQRKSEATNARWFHNVEWCLFR